MAISTEETSALSKFSEWSGALLDVYSGYRSSEAEAEAAKYEYQLAALKQQQEAATYDAQALSDQALTAGVPSVGRLAGSWMALGLVALVTYVYVAGRK